MMPYKLFNVKIYLNDDLVFNQVVRSRTSRTAVSNVLVNIYQGEVDAVIVEPVTIKEGD